MADDTNTAERDSFEAHYRRCGANDATLSRWVDDGSTPPAMVGKYIIRSVQDAWLAFQAGRASLAASAGSEPVAWPKDAAEVREFFNSDFISAKFAAPDGSPCDEDRYYISAHDFLSAINWWADFPHHPSPPEGMAGMVPVAEVVECGTMGQQTLREIDGRWRWLSIGERLYAHADTGFAAPPLPASEAKEL